MPGLRSAAARSFASTALLLASAGGLLGVAVHEHEPWLFGGMSALMALAAAGMRRRSIAAQILSRGAAWTLFGPAALGSVLSLVLDGRTELTAGALAATSGLALLLGRPMLHTPSARAEFAPVRFRRWLLGGAVASVVMGLGTGILGAAYISWDGSRMGAPLLALSGALLASALGVARMRSWGVLLGMLTSAIVCATALSWHAADGMLLAIAAIPGLMLTVPVLLRGQTGPEARAVPTAALTPRPVAVAPARRFRLDDDLVNASADATVLLVEPSDEANDGQHAGQSARRV